MSTSPVCFAGATERIVGTCRHTLHLLRSRNCSCTKDYVDNAEDGNDNVDADNAVLVDDADKNAGYGVRTSWSPKRWVLAVKGERVCAPMLNIPIHAGDCVAGVIVRIILGPDSASFGITSWPCRVC